MRRNGASQRGGRWAAALVLAVLALAAAGCGSDSDGGPPTLNWYINPDDGGQKEIASRCTKSADGRYTIKTSVLPRSASDQREQLLRRLAAEDASIDLMSLDPVFIAEFSRAGFLAPIPADQARALTEGVVGPATKGATWRGRLRAAPMWANTQLLWYRKSVARKAGLDPEARPVTWAQIISAARSTGSTVAIQAKRYEGYTVLINALMESAGGHIVTNPGAPADRLKLGMVSPAGERTASIIRSIATGGVAGPSMSNADEEATRTDFQSGEGGFMVNWPYVWRAAAAAVDDGSLTKDVVDDIGWALYPRATAGRPSRPPLGGIDLGVSRWSKHRALGLEAVRCITSAENQRYYFLKEGNPAAREDVYADAEVRKAFPMAPLLLKSLKQSATRPQTEVYGDLSSAIQREWHPPDELTPATPAKAQKFTYQVLDGQELV
jgi:trehalose/maltose transport system substrate-binding protein